MSGTEDVSLADSSVNNQVRIIFPGEEATARYIQPVSTICFTDNRECYFDHLARLRHGQGQVNAGSSTVIRLYYPDNALESVVPEAKIASQIIGNPYGHDPRFSSDESESLARLLSSKSLREDIQTAQQQALAPIEQAAFFQVLNETYYAAQDLGKLPPVLPKDPSIIHEEHLESVERMKQFVEQSKPNRKFFAELRHEARVACQEGNFELSRWILSYINQELFQDVSPGVSMGKELLAARKEMIDAFYWDAQDYVLDPDEHGTAEIFFNMLQPENFKSDRKHSFKGEDANAFLRHFIKGNHLALALKTLEKAEKLTKETATTAYLQTCKTGEQAWMRIVFTWYDHADHHDRMAEPDDCLRLSKHWFSGIDGVDPRGLLACATDLGGRHITTCYDDYLLHEGNSAGPVLESVEPQKPAGKLRGSVDLSVVGNNRTGQGEGLAAGVFSMFGSVASGISAASQSLALPNAGSASAAAAVVQNSFEHDLVLNTGRALLMTGTEQLVQEICERFERGSNETYGYKFLASSLVALAWSQACELWFSSPGLSLVDCVGIVMMPILLELACLVFNKFTAVNTSERISNSFKDFAQDFLNYFRISYPNARNVAGTVMKMYMANILFAGASCIAGKTGAVTGLVVAGAMFGAAAAGGYVGHELAVGTGITTKLGSKV